jgi:TolB-like protein/DNA-binding winged helix-turn-helix (wHTH) protein/Flp pilus assembly protein TadD
MLYSFAAWEMHNGQTEGRSLEPAQRILKVSSNGMALDPNRLYEFGPFSLSPRERRLLHNGQRVELTPKAFETLLVLAQNSGHVLKKEELLQQIWPNSFVEESNLTQNIFILRKILGNDNDGNSYIETVPRHGYRFAGSVREIESKQSIERAGLDVSRSPAQRAFTRYRVITALVLGITLVVGVYFAQRRLRPRTPQPQGKIMLAVLPFNNLSEDPAQEYFADGFTEEMITQLGRLGQGQLGVIARTSAMQYRNTQKRADQIGRELGVEYLLEGSVRREGDRVRITAQLIQARDQTHVWAEEYDRDLQDVLMLQRDVARSIAREIEVKLTPQPQNRLASDPAVDRKAYDLYLKGRYSWNKRTEEGFTKAIDYFQQAIVQEPNYALGYAGLADAYALLGSLANAEMPRKEAMPLARAAALKALEIDETLSEAHTSLAFVRMHYDWDWPGAEKEFERAIQLNPDYATAHQWHAYNLMVLGRTEDSLTEIHQALKLDPLSLIINTDAIELTYYARRYDEAIRQGRKTIEMDPRFPLARAFTALCYLQIKQYAQAIVELQAAVLESGDRIDMRANLAAAYALAGRPDDARKVLKGLNDSPHRSDMAFHVARVYVALGEKDEALSLLETAYRERSGPLILLQVDPGNDSMRSDPRFQDLRYRIGLHQ